MYAGTTYNDVDSVVFYKDYMFYVLFEKQPRYFRETYEGELVLIEKTGNWDDEVSESESYFDVHNTPDGLRALISGIDIVCAVTDIIFALTPDDVKIRPYPTNEGMVFFYTQIQDLRGFRALF